ncbi:GntR family transcriptional regulator [Inquilinus limosus]|uniref:GntR family transcriptional regulator n=1 Tax=Inquilinus limosus TaxID=171674 RepID=UPI003F177B2B
MLAIAQEGVRPGKSAEVFDGLKRMIMLGELAPGLALLELELAQRFQCSQGTVREALLALQEEGLVHRQPHKGTRVADCTEDEAVEMFRLRHGIETRGIVRALRRPDPALLPDLTVLIEGMEAKARAGDEYGQTELDRAFHRRLFRTAGLPAVEPLLHRCILHNHRFKITRSGERRDLMATARRHWTIVEALTARDEAAAVAAIGHHIETIVDVGPSIFGAAEESRTA